MTPARELRQRLETHRSLKNSSPGFHLSDEDVDLLIEALKSHEREKDHGA
jgi:hypothetical protein